MNIAYPYTIDGSGRTAQPDDDQHIRQMIEQLLFTAPGERVNRPTFEMCIRDRCWPRWVHWRSPRRRRR